MQEEKFPQGTARTAVIQFSWASLLPGSTGIAGAHCYKQERWRWARGGGKKPQTGAYLMTHSIPPRARVLAIMMFIPFKAETELPIKQCLSKEPPLVLRLPQPELVYSTGNILKKTAKQPTTTYITKWHNNLCKASQNCGLGYILHFSPTTARHNPEVVKMPVNKMVLTRRHPSGGSLLRHG